MEKIKHEDICMLTLLYFMLKFTALLNKEYNPYLEIFLKRCFETFYCKPI